MPVSYFYSWTYNKLTATIALLLQYYPNLISVQYLNQPLYVIISDLHIVTIRLNKLAYFKTNLFI